MRLLYRAIVDIKPWEDGYVDSVLVGLFTSYKKARQAAEQWAADAKAAGAVYAEVYILTSEVNAYRPFQAAEWALDE